MGTIQATCKCGSTFNRPVKRGRPQMWCEPCLLIPHGQRPVGPPPEVTSEGESSGSEKNQWDKNRHKRDQIEANVSAFYATWPSEYVRLHASGMDSMEIAMVQADGIRKAYKDAGAED